MCRIGSSDFETVVKVGTCPDCELKWWETRNNARVAHVLKSVYDGYDLKEKGCTFGMWNCVFAWSCVSGRM